MTEKIIVTILPLFYLTAFIGRNLVVRKHTKQAVRGKSPLIALSIALTTSVFITTVLSTYSKQWYSLMGAINYPRSCSLTYLGFLLFAISVIFGWNVSAQLKDSWRVGVIENQKTELIKSGVYGHIRNPYFLSYYLMLFSLFLVRPSLVLMILMLLTVAVFHFMVLREERYLRNVHGEEYVKYKRITGRYLPRLSRKESRF